MSRKLLSRERIKEIRAETFAEHEAGAPATMPAATIVLLCDAALARDELLRCWYADCGIHNEDAAESYEIETRDLIGWVNP